MLLLARRLRAGALRTQLMGQGRLQSLLGKGLTQGLSRQTPRCSWTSLLVRGPDQAWRRCCQPRLGSWCCCALCRLAWGQLLRLGLC